jgi:hypothetical protein
LEEWGWLLGVAEGLAQDGNGFVGDERKYLTDGNNLLPDGGKYAGD